MGSTPRSRAVLLLVILAFPVASVALAGGLGLHGFSLTRWYLVSLLACAVPGLALGLFASSQSAKPGQPLNERRSERQTSTIGLMAALGIDSFALLLGMSSPIVTVVIVAAAGLWVLLWLQPGLRSVVVRSSVVIQRDPATVFAYLSDFQNEPSYIPEVESVEKMTSGPIGPGTQFRSRARLGPNVFEAVEEIVDYQPNSRLTSRVASGLRPNLDVMTFEPAPGGTLLKHQFDIESSYNSALLGSGLSQWFVTRRMVARRQAAWARVKQILESGATGT